MKHALLIFTAFIALAYGTSAQEQPKPTETPKPADLAFTTQELGKLAELGETEQTLALMRQSVVADMAEVDKTLTSSVFNAKLAVFAANRRRASLFTQKLIEKQATQLQADVKAWIATVRTRANCLTCEPDFQNRRLVLPQGAKQ